MTFVDAHFLATSSPTYQNACLGKFYCRREGKFQDHVFGQHRTEREKAV